MESKAKAKPTNLGVRVVKAKDPYKTPTVFQKVEKSDKSEQLTRESSVNASEWINHPVHMHGLKDMVDHSTILPQCIKAYKSNIAGFGISVQYSEDYDEETSDMKEEWDILKKIVALLNMDIMTKEVFENIIRDRETYGISYGEVIRNIKGEVVELQFIIDTPSIDMTYPLEPYVDTTYFYKGEEVKRKKKFRKYRQTVNGKTVYFKEFGDPRIMDKYTGEYLQHSKDGEEMENIELDDQANEIIDFRIGSMPYGEVRWLGQVLTIDGNRKAEVLNNSYFSKGRHTPLMILVKNGTLTEDSFDKLQSYMDGIRGEAGQHAFLVLETDHIETTSDFEEKKEVDIEIKDLASVLQKDELFQEYLENGRKKTQSSFLLPDLYVGYTKDFNRATAQTAMEVTEKQVFQPERESLAWLINNRLLNAYNFKYVKVIFNAPDMTNPDDIYKILNVTERAGGMSPNVAKELTYKTLGKEGCEDYEGDWGDTPIAYLQKATTQQSIESYPPVPVTEDILSQLDTQTTVAKGEDASVYAIMKEIRKALIERAGEQCV